MVTKASSKGGDDGCADESCLNEAPAESVLWIAAAAFVTGEGAFNHSHPKAHIFAVVLALVSILLPAVVSVNRRQ